MTQTMQINLITDCIQWPFLNRKAVFEFNENLPTQESNVRHIQNVLLVCFAKYTNIQINCQE